MPIPRRKPLFLAGLLILGPLAMSALLSRAPSARAAVETRAALAGPQRLTETRPRSEPRPPLTPERSRFLRGILPKVGSDTVFRKIAGELGLTRWQGKRLEVLPTRKGSANLQGMALDRPVDTSLGSQNSPSIAVDPTDDSRVVVFALNDDNFSVYDNACSIYLSFDGGFSFFYIKDVPLLFATDSCAYPVVRYSPDGNVVYYSYLSIRDDSSASDVLVVEGEGDDPDTFIGTPDTVFTAFGDFNDMPWIAVHTFDSEDGVTDGTSYVHAVSTRFNLDGSCGVYFNHSTDYGATWEGVWGMGSLDYSIDCYHNLPIGGRVAAGVGPQVLVCYFDSAEDGLSVGLAPPALSNRFHIYCRSSSDRGVSFLAPFPVARNIPYEVNDFLGPNELYHRWFPSMFPSVTIDHRGTAHIVFTMDPTASKVDTEAGNVQYARSTASGSIPPYNTWSARMTIGSGGKAQGFPSVVAQSSLLTSHSYIYVAYYDHYRSPGPTPNRIYDLRYRKSVNGGNTFAPPVTVTIAPSLSDPLYIGDFFDTTTTNRRYHLVWTDRGDKRNPADEEDDIFIRSY